MAKKERTGFAMLPGTWAKARMPGALWQVLLAVAQCADSRTRRCYPSISRLVEDTALDRRTVTRALGRLQEIGALSIVGTSAYGTNIYQLHDEYWAETLDDQAPTKGTLAPEEQARGAHAPSTADSNADARGGAPAPLGGGAGLPLPVGGGTPLGVGATVARGRGKGAPAGRGNPGRKVGAGLPPRTDHRTDHGTDHGDGDAVAADWREALTPDGREALGNLSRASHNPKGWLASVSHLAPGGIESLCSWEILSQALSDMSGNGQPPNIALLRGCVRKAKQYASAPADATPDQLRAQQEAALRGQWMPSRAS